LKKNFCLGALGSFECVFTQEGMWLDFVIFWGVLNACANMATLEKATPFITKSFKVIWNHMSLWGIV
jgi:hypothetical protein